MAGEEKQMVKSPHSWGERSRQWVLTIGAVLAVLGTAAGFLSDTLGLWEFAQEAVVVPTPVFTSAPPMPDEQAQRLMLALTNGTPTPAPTATATALPSPTPLPVVANPGERLLVIAQFANYARDTSFNVAGRIKDALDAQVRAAQLSDTRVAVWPNEVADGDSAVMVLTSTGAAMVIWGEYDSGRVRVNFALPQAGSRPLGWEQMLSAPTELSTIINLDVPRESQALALMALGRLYREAGDLARARAAFVRALALAPTSQETLATLTFYLAYLDTLATPPDLTGAIERYTQVIELRSDWFNAYYNRGAAYLNRYWQRGEPEDLAQAIADFSTTLAERPAYAEAYINRGIAYYTRNDAGDLDLAIADLNNAVDRAPDSHRAYYNRGLAYVRANEQDAWIADLEKALELAPDFWAANYALCWGYALDNAPEMALPHCEVAVARDESGSTRDARALVMAELGRLDEAADDLQMYVDWLNIQSPVWFEINKGQVYSDLLAQLRAGENPVRPEFLAQLR